MTIATTSNKAQWQGNGATSVFSFAFEIGSANQALLYLTSGGSTTLIPSSSYSISGLGIPNGGTITYPLSGSPIASGQTLTLIRIVPLQQLCDLINQSNYFPDAVEGALDYLMMAVQQLALQIAFTIQTPTSDPTLNLTLPNASARGQQLVGFDSSGNVITYPVTASIGAGDLRAELGGNGQPGFKANTDFTPGTTTTLILSRAYGSVSNVQVYFDGTYQEKDSYQLNGTSLIFNAAIPVGVSNVDVIGGTTLSVGTPGLGTVGPAQLNFLLGGPTSQRPIPQSVGQQFYDTTLGYEVAAASLSPVAWKPTAGAQLTVNMLNAGADPTGVADCSAALTAALAQCINASQIDITFPPGTYYFASSPTISMTSSQTAPASIRIRGSGSGVTRFKFAGSGFTINYGSAYTSVHMEGISFLAPSAGGTFGLTLTQNATFATGFGAYGVTTLRDLEFRGDDGFNENHYWGTACSILGASNINWYDCTFYGPTNTPSGAGIVLGFALNDHTIIPIIYNVMGCTFTHLQSGLIYGGNCQGLSVLYSNFTANFSGIIVPTGSSAVDQLLVNSSQFNNINDSIYCQALCQAVSVMNCFFLISNSSVGVNVGISANTSIVGNIFSTANGSPVNQQGVQIGTYNQGASVITGNQFNGLTIGVDLLAASSLVNVQSNCYQGNTTNVQNAGTGNTLGGGSQ